MLKKHRRRAKIKKSLWILLISALLVWGIRFWGTHVAQISQLSEYIESTVGVLSLVISVGSAILIVAELNESGKLQEAEFTLNLNQSFVGNEKYARMYIELEKSDLEQTKPDITRIEISNYLTFFETVYLLLESKAVQMKTLDDLFAYRFFLAVHNETIQEMKLVSAPYNFRNIYYLEWIWMEYRREKGLNIYKEEYSLYNSCKRAGKEAQYLDIISNLEAAK